MRTTAKRQPGVAVPPLDDSPVMVHIASRVTEEVFSFLGPATAALKNLGITPILIALDDTATRTWLGRFDPSVRLILVPAGQEPLGNFVRLRATTLAVLRRCKRLEGIHFHGVIPRMLGTPAVRSLGIRAPVYFSPHASKLLGLSGLSGRVLQWASSLRGEQTPQQPIASHKVDVQRMAGLGDSRVSLLESPVLKVFLEVKRQEADTAIIVGGGQTPDDDAAIEMFTRFAVLLRDTAHQPVFYWIGTVNSTQRSLLQSVKAQLVSKDNETERADLLSRAWIYLAMAGGRGVPVGLIEAMAAGVPCCAADTPFNREVVEHQVSGFIYDSEEEALQTIADLLDTSQMRSAISEAAHGVAISRFDDESFRKRILQTYGRHESTEALGTQIGVSDPSAHGSALSASSPPENGLRAV